VTKAKHGRKRRLRWKPWAKWVHLGAFTWAAAFVSFRADRLNARTFDGQLFLSAMWTVIIYAVLTLVLGFLISTSEKHPSGDYEG